MLPYYLCPQPALPTVEKEQETCENVFAALLELKKLFDPANQPNIEDHVAVRTLGERIAELALQVHDGLLECVKFGRNTYYPRVVLITTWAEVHDMFCQFAIDWCAKFSRYEKSSVSMCKSKRYTKKEDKLLSGYVRCIDDPNYVNDKMYHDSDIAMICETVVAGLCRAGLTMCPAERYDCLVDEYNSNLYMIVESSMSILAYGIQCFMGMLVRLEKKSETLWTLNDDANGSFLHQYERYEEKYGQAIFMDVLRSFDPSALENNLPHISKSKWKHFLDKKLAEILGSPVGRECAAEINKSSFYLPIEKLGIALVGVGCSMDELSSYMRLFYEYKIAKGAYWTIKEWEKKDGDRLTALEFYDRLKRRVQVNESQAVKRRTHSCRSRLKVMDDTYCYKWLGTDEYRLGRLFQVLQSKARWIDDRESPDDFFALFSGEPKEFHIKWCGTKQHLYHLFKVIFERGLVTWGRKNGQWLILQSHFKDKNGHAFSSFNGEKESIKAKATIERMVDILDPAVRAGEDV